MEGEDSTRAERRGAHEHALAKAHTEATSAKRKVGPGTREGKRPGGQVAR